MITTKHKNNSGHRLLLFCILCLFGICLTAMQPVKHKVRPKSDNRVHLLHSDVLYYDQFKNPEAQILVGNVQFQHEGVKMYCDSACYYELNNSFDAFGRVRMVQGDTLSLTGDVLFYNGLDQLARVRHNVVLKHRASMLYTDSLDYDRLYDLGYFFEGGKLVDDKNVLTSDWGQYSPSTREAVFNYNVKLTNPKFTLVSDTLIYNTQTDMAQIVGPSNIDSGDSHIYSETGFYDTKQEKAYLLNRSILENKGKRMVGDSLYYDSSRKIGKAYNHIVFTDEINKMGFTGNYCYSDEIRGYSEASDSAIAMDYSQKDTLFLHADTFKIYTFNIETDTVYRELRAYNKVRAFRIDVQAVCDSMVFSSKDSCLSMYKDPIVWNKNQQLLGEEIKVYMNDSTVDWAHIINQALSVEKLDSNRYNQINGNEIKAFFKQGKIHFGHVIGNAHANYFMFDSDSLVIGVNNTETSEIKVYMNEGKLARIWTPAATGTITPIPFATSSNLFLSNFAWFDYIRPTDKDDIFNWRSKKQGTELKLKPRRHVPLQKLDKFKTKP